MAKKISKRRQAIEEKLTPGMEPALKMQHLMFLRNAQQQNLKSQLMLQSTWVLMRVNLIKMFVVPR